nr:receptor-like serine/threonine-protein kinase NCRK isoform X1 [Ipomoea batatas]
MRFTVKLVIAGLISLAWIEQVNCEGPSNSSETSKWTCSCFTNLSIASAANCSSSCDCNPDGSSQSKWMCICSAEGLPTVAAGHNNTGCFTSCNCSFGTPVVTQYPKKWISSKAVFVILLLCSAVATLAFIALMLCYIYQRDKYSVQRHIFSPDKETSFSSATNLISQGASSETESKVSAATPTNFVTGCIPKTSLLFRSKMGAPYGMIIQFSYFDLENATDRFSASNLIGVGGSSQVYRGQLKDGRIIAVKRIKIQGGPDSESSFLTEIELISRLHHCHVVPLLGYCLEYHGKHAQRLLVFEYMPNGSLRDCLDGASGRCLDWATRVTIAFGAARGTNFLNSFVPFCLSISRFLVSNLFIYLNYFQITDLGMAKHLQNDGVPSCSSSPARMQGTFGYFAPEYAIVGRASLKSDVFSFGVVLLELITGRQPIQKSMNRGEESLVIWATPRLQDSKRVISELPDPNMKGAFEEEEMQIMAYLAKECLLLDPDSRPTMSEVVQILSTIAPEKSKRKNFMGHSFKSSFNHGIESYGRTLNPTGEEEIKQITCENQPAHSSSSPPHSDLYAEISQKEANTDSAKYEESEIVLSSNAKKRRSQDDEAVDLTEPRFESFHVPTVIYTEVAQ